MHSSYNGWTLIGIDILSQPPKNLLDAGCVVQGQSSWVKSISSCKGGPLCTWWILICIFKMRCEWAVRGYSLFLYKSYLLSRGPLMMLITLIFSRLFHSNFIIQYLLFSTCSVLLYHATLCYMDSCKCRRGLSDPWNICFYCSCCFSLFSDIVLFCVSKIKWWWWWCDGSRTLQSHSELPWAAPEEGTVGGQLPPCALALSLPEEMLAVLKCPLVTIHVNDIRSIFGPHTDFHPPCALALACTLLPQLQNPSAAHARYRVI